MLLNRSGRPSRKKNFPICQPHAKNLFQAVLFQSGTKINGLIYDLTVIPYLEDNAVHPDYQVNRIKGAILPLLGSLIDFVGNDGNGR